MEAEKKEQGRHERVLKAEQVFSDSRGKIANYLLPENVNWIGVIHTKKGSVRANHYHPIQEQKLLFLTGKCLSVYKDLSVKDAPVKKHVVHAGDCIVTPPNVAHAIVFLEDSLSLNLVKGDREQDNFEEHTKKYALVDEKLKQKYLAEYESLFAEQKRCRGCHGKNLHEVISFGKIPLANNLIKKEDLSQREETFPLTFIYCDDCHMCQLGYVVLPEKMFRHYLFVTATAEATRAHFKEMADTLITDFNLNADSFVVDIGSNDGFFLDQFQKKNISVMGIEPAENIAELANKNKIPTLNDYICERSVREVVDVKGKADIVTANNVFAHVADIDEFVTSVQQLLTPNGAFVIEAQYVLDTLRTLTFDNIYHEHLSYFSVMALNNFFKRHSMDIFKIEHFENHGGTIRVYVQNDHGSNEIDSSVRDFISREKDFGLDKLETYKSFAKGILREREEFLKFIKDIKEDGKSIVGYGAPAKATTLLNFFNVDTKYIDYIVEDNELKQGYLVPGVHIPIRSPAALESNTDYVIIFAWNFAEEIIKNNQKLQDKGVKFVISKDLTVI